jgi:HPt (histidine-containing phosphotransfer) domain-containing protein
LDSAEQSALTEALDRLWARFIPQIEERVAVLESAAAALNSGQLSVSQSEAASAAAHKLAGVLGTFGLDKGTVLARELEIEYSRVGGLDPAGAGRLIEMVAGLRAMIESHK